MSKATWPRRWLFHTRIDARRPAAKGQERSRAQKHLDSRSSVKITRWRKFNGDIVEAGRRDNVRGKHHRIIARAHRAHKERIGRIEWQSRSRARKVQGISADQWYFRRSILRETATNQISSDEVRLISIKGRLYMGKQRDGAQKYYLPRVAAIHLTKQFTAHSYPVIGRHLATAITPPSCTASRPSKR